jgi:hypothetical protein
MALKNYTTVAFTILLLSACKYINEPKTNNLDLSQQWAIDNYGYATKPLNDGQWQKKIFTDKELGLFTSLDTTSLHYTAAPITVKEIPSRYNATYPNPFISFNNLSFKFNNGYTGQVVLKVVIVDNTMKTQYIGTSRLSDQNTSIQFKPIIPKGNYRFYYTLSAEGNPHFYKSWGNILKVI